VQNPHHEKRMLDQSGQWYNRLVVFLNGEMIWDSGIIHNDPQLHKAVEITQQLNNQEGFPNELIFEGFNDMFSESGNPEDLNPWHFSYRVISNAFSQQFAD
jgi:hypothetical protein